MLDVFYKLLKMLNEMEIVKMLKMFSKMLELFFWCFT